MLPEGWFVEHNHKVLTFSSGNTVAGNKKKKKEFAFNLPSVALIFAQEGASLSQNDNIWLCLGCFSPCVYRMQMNSRHYGPKHSLRHRWAASCRLQDASRLKGWSDLVLVFLQVSLKGQSDNRFRILRPADHIGPVLRFLKSSCVSEAWLWFIKPWLV